MAAAWWRGSLAEFRGEADEAIVAKLAQRLVESHPLNRAAQVQAWRAQVAILHGALGAFPVGWRLLFAYPLLRVGRRLDAVFVTPHAIFVLEFKIGARTFDQGARRQIEDYALDLQDFHGGSRHAVIVPILIASEAPAQAPLWPLILCGVTPVFESAPAGLQDLLTALLARLPVQNIDIGAWEQAPYRPVPTIIEAATMLYARHGVADIAAARADTANLTRTTDVILAAIAAARRDRRQVIVFVTGIPGAGKTLCGLNAVFGADTGAAFLTGNLPLVHVLREAFARDAAAQGASIRQARQKTESAIQGLTGFVRDNVARAEPPYEHVLVFDEAQRAWDADYGKRKFQLNDSEAALCLDIMRKHEDFAVIIALVGNGQEINTGEAGLGEWGRALAQRPDWDIRAAPMVLTTDQPRQRLFETPPPGIVVDVALHLDVPIRSVRSRDGAPWVDRLLRGDAAEATRQAQDGVPFYVTRSLAALRAGLRALARGERRAGLVCSTGARRLVADGIWPDFPHLDNDAVANWFLNRWPDVRASDALEIPATQFAAQGLELDYVGLCWGGDFVWDDGWLVRRFAGTRWQIPKDADAIEFRRNTYRVLLTRARYDTIIWVPEGDPADATREPHLFDQTAAFLLRCGATMLPAVVSAEGVEESKEALLF